MGERIIKLSDVGLILSMIIQDEKYMEIVESGYDALEQLSDVLQESEEIVEVRVQQLNLSNNKQLMD